MSFSYLMCTFYVSIMQCSTNNQIINVPMLTTGQKQAGHPTVRHQENPPEPRQQDIHEEDHARGEAAVTAQP